MIYREAKGSLGATNVGMRSTGEKLGWVGVGGVCFLFSFGVVSMVDDYGDNDHV